MTLIPTPNELAIMRAEASEIRFFAPLCKGSMRTVRLMGEDYIMVKFDTTEPVPFQVGDYANWKGERFEITRKPQPTRDRQTGAYCYELRLDAQHMKWANKLMKFSPRNGAEELSFALTASLGDHLQTILERVNSLASEYPSFLHNGVDPWEAQIAEDVDAVTAKTVDYSNVDIISALNSLASAYETEWWVRDGIIYVGRCSIPGDPLPIVEGYNATSIECSDTGDRAPNRIYAYGSTRNIPSHYRRSLIFDITRKNGRRFADETRPLDHTMFRKELISEVRVNRVVSPWYVTDDPQTTDVKGTATAKSYGDGQLFISDPFCRWSMEAVPEGDTFDKGDVEVDFSGIDLRAWVEISQRSGYSGDELQKQAAALTYISLWGKLTVRYEDGTVDSEQKSLGGFSKGWGSLVTPGSNPDGLKLYTPMGKLAITAEKRLTKVTLDLWATATFNLSTPKSPADIRERFPEYGSALVTLHNPLDGTIRPSQTHLYIGPSAYSVTGLIITFRKSDGSSTHGNFVFNPDNNVGISEENVFSAPTDIPEGYTKFTIENSALVLTKVPASYFSEEEGAANVAVGAIGERRLRMPESFGDYVDAEPGLTADEIVEDVVIFEDVYPSREEMIPLGGVEEYEESIKDTSEAGQEIIKRKAYRIKSTGFNARNPFLYPDYILEGQSLFVTFSSGALNGRTFEATFGKPGEALKNPDGTYNDNAQWFGLVHDNDSNLPNEKCHPLPGDKFRLTGMDVSVVDSHMIPNGEAELRTKALEYVGRLKSDDKTYEATIACDHASGDLASSTTSANIAHGTATPTFIPAGKIGTGYTTCSAFWPINPVAERARYRISAKISSRGTAALNEENFVAFGGSIDGAQVSGCNSAPITSVAVGDTTPTKIECACYLTPECNGIRLAVCNIGAEPGGGIIVSELMVTPYAIGQKIWQPSQADRTEHARWVANDIYLGSRIALVMPERFFAWRDSRVIGYDIPLDIPYDSPRLQIGEKQPYSRTGEISNKLQSLQATIGSESKRTSGFLPIGSASGGKMITSHDKTTPSDANYFSAARSILEFCTRKSAETISHIWEFLAGIKVRNLEVGGGTASISQEGQLSANRIVAPEIVSDEEARPEMNGCGLVAQTDTKTGQATIFTDFLNVRQGLTVSELTIQKINTVDGMVVISKANGVVANATLNLLDSTLNIKLKEENTFVVGDLIRWSAYDKESNTLRSGWYEVKALGNGNRLFDIKAKPVAPTTLDLAMKPHEGDVLAQMGHVSNPARQGVIVISVEDGVENISVYSGIDAPSLPTSKLRARLGSLSGIIKDGQPLSGYGLYGDNAHLTGSFSLSTTGKDVADSIAEAAKETGRNLVKGTNQKTSDWVFYPNNGTLSLFKSASGIGHGILFRARSVNNASEASCFEYCFSGGLAIETGKNYVASVRYRVLSTLHNPLKIGFAVRTQDNQVVAYSEWWRRNADTSGEWAQVDIPFVSRVDGSISQDWKIGWWFNGNELGNMLEIILSDIMLTEGTEAHPYAPAPEDNEGLLSAAIGAAKTEIQADLNSIRMSVQNYQGSLQSIGISPDGIVLHADKTEFQNAEGQTVALFDGDSINAALVKVNKLVAYQDSEHTKKSISINEDGAGKNAIIIYHKDGVNKQLRIGLMTVDGRQTCMQCYDAQGNLSWYLTPHGGATPANLPYSWGTTSLVMAEQSNLAALRSENTLAGTTYYQFFAGENADPSLAIHSGRWYVEITDDVADQTNFMPAGTYYSPEVHAMRVSVGGNMNQVKSGRYLYVVDMHGKMAEAGEVACDEISLLMIT